MNLDESVLRQLLVSAYGTPTVQAIFAAIEQGQPCGIVMDDGTALELKSLPEAYEILQDRFGWQPAASP